MPVTIDWDNDAHTALLMTFSGRWTWDDVYKASDRSNRELLVSIDHRVDIILDFHTQFQLADAGAVAHPHPLEHSQRKSG